MWSLLYGLVTVFSFLGNLITMLINVDPDPVLFCSSRDPARSPHPPRGLELRLLLLPPLLPAGAAAQDQEACRRPRQYRDLQVGS